MVTTAPQRPQLLTAADFWKIAHQPAYAELSLELVEGVSVEMSRRGW